MSLLSTFIVNPELSVVCFRRDNCKNGPFFAVREFDIKVIRSRDKGRRGRGPSEQAIRASIRQAVLNMNLKSERASKSEIRQLKGHGILGKRAPSCSLLCAEDMCRLLEAFGKDACVRDLRSALLKDRKSDENEKKPKNNADRMPLKRKTLSPRPTNSKFVKSDKDEKSSDVTSLKRARQLDSYSRPKKLDSLSPTSPQLEHIVGLNDSNGLDALYSALLAFSGSVDPTPSLNPVSLSLETPPSLLPSPSQEAPSPPQEVENVLDTISPVYSLPSPISISPTVSPSTSPSRDPWSFPSPKSPSSPLGDSPFQRFPAFLSSSSDNLSAEDLTTKSMFASSLSPLSYSHPTVLRPRKKKVGKSRLAAEISSLSSDILAKLDQSKAATGQRISTSS